MQRLLVGIFLLALSAATASAAEGFSCGGADVEFNFLKRQAEHADHHVEIVISVRRSGRASVLRYDGNVDVVGGVCVPNGRGKPTVVFQAYCSGSGCADLENWGIVDPSDLRVRLVPNDWNCGDAEKILGRPLPKIEHPVYVVDEARKLGLKW